MLRAVNANWNDGGWNVNANELDNSNEWNDGNQVFSRNYCVSPIIFLVGVLLQVLSSSHRADEGKKETIESYLGMLKWGNTEKLKKELKILIGK